MLVCKNCGAKLADHSKFCYACKTPVTPDTPSVSRNMWQEKYGAGKENPEILEPGDPRIPEDPDDPFGFGFGDDRDFDELRAAIHKLEEQQKKANAKPTDEMLYIGDGAFSYVMKFAKLRESKKLVSWNWWAFLIGPAWFIYRKMYLLGAAMLMVDLWVTLFFTNSFYYYMVTIIMDVLMGLFADSIYMNHIERLVEHSKGMSEDEEAEDIRRKGGSSFTIMLITLLAFQIIYFVLVNLMI